MLVSAIFATALAGHALVFASQAMAQSENVLGGGGSTQNTQALKELDSDKPKESIEGFDDQPDDQTADLGSKQSNFSAAQSRAVEARAPDTLIRRAGKAYLGFVSQRHFAPALSAAIVATTGALFYGNATIRNALLDADASVWAAPLPLGAAMMVLNMAVMFNGFRNIAASRMFFGVCRPLYNHNFFISTTLAMAAYLVVLTYLPLADPADASSVGESITLTKSGMLLALSAINCHVITPLVVFLVDRVGEFVESRFAKARPRSLSNFKLE